MALKPTLRDIKRYILFEVHADKTAFAPADVIEAVEEGLRTFLGELGMARAGVMVIKELTQGKYIVLRVVHTHTAEARAALILIKKIKNTPVLLRSVVTSGTLKKIRERMRL